MSTSPPKLERDVYQLPGVKVGADPKAFDTHLHSMALSETSTSKTFKWMSWQNSRFHALPWKHHWLKYRRWRSSTASSTRWLFGHRAINPSLDLGILIYNRKKLIPYIRGIWWAGTDTMLGIQILVDKYLPSGRLESKLDPCLRWHGHKDSGHGQQFMCYARYAQC